MRTHRQHLLNRENGDSMRIALLAWESLHSFAIGGVAVHVTELAAALARQGHEVHVFTRRAPGQSDYACVDGVHYYRCAYKPHREFVDDINNMCRAFVHRLFGVEDSTGQPFEIVHAHDWLCANAMIWIKKGRERRGILTIHATEYGRSGNLFHDGRSKRIRHQERAGCDWADHVIGVSGATCAEVQWMYEVPDWKLSVVHNGVNRHRFAGPVDVEQARRRYQVGPMDPVALFCGRLDYQKGPDILLEAFPAALQQHPPAKLVFAGDGGMRRQLEQRAHQLGIADAVRLLGQRSGDELVEVFRMADVACVPSRNEPFGIVVLEAWAAGKPVLATHNGGPAEFVDHEINGLKIYDSAESVAWGLQQIFGDFDRARQMGQRGLDAVRYGFTWDAVAQQTLAVYAPEQISATCDADVPSEVPEPGADVDTDDPAVTAEGTSEGENARPSVEEPAGSASNEPVTAASAVSVDLHTGGDSLSVARGGILTAARQAKCQVALEDDGTTRITGDAGNVAEALARFAQNIRESTEQLKLHVDLRVVRKQMWGDPSESPATAGNGVQNRELANKCGCQSSATHAATDRIRDSRGRFVRAPLSARRD